MSQQGDHNFFFRKRQNWTKKLFSLFCFPLVCWVESDSHCVFPSLPNNYCGKIENWLQKYLQRNFKIIHWMKLSSISFKILSQDIFLEEKNVFTKGGGAQMFGLLEKMCEIWLTDDHFCLSLGGQATKRPRTLLASLWEPWWSPFKVRWAEEEIPHLWRS